MDEENRSKSVIISLTIEMVLVQAALVFGNYLYNLQGSIIAVFLLYVVLCFPFLFGKNE
jgi:hypothetical protein